MINITKYNIISQLSNKKQLTISILNPEDIKTSLINLIVFSILWYNLAYFQTTKEHIYPT